MFSSGCGCPPSNFFNSFFKDYDSVLGVSAGDYEVHTTIDVWIGRGKDWGMLLKQMADEDFTPKTGIGIRLNILPAGQLGAGSVNAMLLAISSGRAPDVGLATSTNSIGEFALRNAVVDLSGLEGFAEVRERFLPELFIPMTYQDGIYGLPETMKFTALLYRKVSCPSWGSVCPRRGRICMTRSSPSSIRTTCSFTSPRPIRPRWKAASACSSASWAAGITATT